jgi:NAD(P)-dependent dehydrogenase (short-subunit alcohol dehydrogenase family)
MYGLQGRRAIVTGAAYGIGRGIASRLAAEGCDLGLFDLDLPAVERLADELSRSGHRVALAAGDVSSRADVQAGMGRLMEGLGGGADILVNNAGICRIGKLLDMEESDWRATFGINVDGLFYTTRAVVPGMVERRSGVVVNLASWMGKSGAEAYGAYCASKFAVVALTQSLALELGEHGVRVNAVAPGLVVQTKMRDESEEKRRREGLPLAEERAKAIPLRRAAVPEDIAKAVAFLASDQADYITGETLSVTGGIWND